MKYIYDRETKIYHDTNGNSASVERWGRPSAALRALKTCHDCHSCHDCHYCHHCHDCHVAGVFGRYHYWATPSRARVGCQDHSPEEWLKFTRADVEAMSHDAGEWYDKYWSAWVAILEAVQK